MRDQRALLRNQVFGTGARDSKVVPLRVRHSLESTAHLNIDCTVPKIATLASPLLVYCVEKLSGKSSSD